MVGMKAHAVRPLSVRPSAQKRTRVSRNPLILLHTRVAQKRTQVSCKSLILLHRGARTHVLYPKGYIPAPLGVGCGALEGMTR